MDGKTIQSLPNPSQQVLIYFQEFPSYTGKLLQIDGYMLRGVWQALNCFSTHATYCVIIAGASPGETKMWAAVRENGGFFALAVRITGKLLKIDGYMLRDNL